MEPNNTPKPNSTNYAAAVFFTLLIIGFTFHLPSLLYGPIIFFCIVAGVLFFRDIMAARKPPQAVPVQPGVYYAPTSIPPTRKKRNIFITLMLVIFGVIGLTMLAFIAFIIFTVVMLGVSGV